MPVMKPTNPCGAITSPATSGHYSPLFAAVVLLGFGTVGTVFGTTVMAASGMADADQGLVGGVVNTTRQVGAGVGVAALVAIAEGAHARAGIATVSGDRTAMLVAALGGLTGTLVAWFGARPGRSLDLSTATSDLSIPTSGDRRYPRDPDHVDEALVAADIHLDDQLPHRIDQFMADAVPVAGPSPEAV